jgi:hypothetical protein
MLFGLNFYFFGLWASRFARLRLLASGYPLHHLRAYACASVVPLLSLSLSVGFAHAAVHLLQNKTFLLV